MLRTCVVLLVFLGGCTNTYPYLIVNDECRCEHYVVHDSDAGILYGFTAEYEVNETIVTRISLEIENRGPDTLRLQQGFVTIDSKNISYRMNGKSLPLNFPDVFPGTSRIIPLQGEWRAATDENPWHRLAGEELTVTIKGLSLGTRVVRAQTFHAVPRNPHLVQ